MNPVTKAIAAGLTRTVLAFLAGHGIDVGDGPAADGVEMALQGALVAVPAIWSAWHKVKVDRKIKSQQP